jgi:hypothetical protein
MCGIRVDTGYLMGTSPAAEAHRIESSAHAATASHLKESPTDQH